MLWSNKVDLICIILWVVSVFIKQEIYSSLASHHLSLPCGQPLVIDMVALLGFMALCLF
jgi:hypothetical protein